MISRIRTLTLVSILVFAGSRGEAIAGRGGFHAGGFGGFHGGGYGGFHAEGAEGFHAGGSGGYHSGGYGGFHAGGAEGFHAGGAEGFHAGGYGSSSFGRSSSYGTSRSYGGYSGLHEGAGSNPYAATGTSHRGGEYASGPYGGHYGAGSGSGSYTTQRGGTVDYGAAGRGASGPGGAEAGRGVYGVSGTTAGGRSFADVGRVGGAMGPGGNAVGGRSNLGAVSGQRGTAVGGSREGFASGAGGTAVAGERGGAAVGAGGGAVAGRSYGAAAVRPYGDAGAFGWHGGSYSGYNSGWVHGYWGGHYGGWGWGGYGGGYGAGLGMGMGLAAWGMGSSLYSGWGYMPYANPYYGAAGAVASPVYNYSQPIDTAAAPPDDSVAAPAMTAFDKARDAFKGGDYASALTLADQAVKSVPGDSAVHEFRAQVLIALGKYDDAAAALYGVLSVGPGWDWTTLISLYPDLETYTAQLRALEKSVRTDPESAAPRFVLAYLYRTEGQNSAAEEQLKAVTQLQPGDRVSAQLLASISKASAAAAASGANPPADAEAKAPVQPAKEGKLEGTWTASPAQGSAITLSVVPGGKFTWKVDSGGQSHVLSGESTYGAGVLTLVPTGGNAPMVGEVKWQDDGRFVFQALGGGAGDPGLTFSRSS